MPTVSRNSKKTERHSPEIASSRRAHDRRRRYYTAELPHPHKTHILPALFDKVLVPQAVVKEMQHPAAPSQVKRWIALPPPWLQIHKVTSNTPLLEALDKGEREAIQLALALRAKTVLIDELHGRRQAQLFQLEVRGTLGILEEAGFRGYTNFHAALSKLLTTDFRISGAVLDDFLKRNST